MTQHNTRGRIAYLDPARNETGSEWFSVTRYADGSRTARCAFSVQLVGLAAPFRISTWSDDCIVVKETWAEMPGSFELAELVTP